MKGKYVAPSLGMDAFHCPHCEVYAMQYWHDAYIAERGFITVGKLKISFCARCGKYALWIDEKMVYPVSSVAPLPVEDMPENVKEDYVEARNIVNFRREQPLPC
ncbi:MAG: hypothetical protein QXI91_04750 [Candidatus Bathyarchaeia archaeon]